MQDYKRLSLLRLGALVLSGIIFTTESSYSLHGEELTGSPVITNNVPLTAFVREQGGGGYTTCRCVYVTIGSERLAFIVPEGFRASVAAEDKVTMVSDDYASTIVFRRFDGQQPVADGDNLKVALSEKYPDATFVEESTVKVARYSGPALDFIHFAGGLKRMTRFGVVTTKAGVFEISISSNPNKFREHQSSFRILLHSFQFPDSEGKLQIPPALGQS